MLCKEQNRILCVEGDWEMVYNTKSITEYQIKSKLQNKCNFFENTLTKCADLMTLKKCHFTSDISYFENNREFYNHFYDKNVRILKFGQNILSVI